MRADLVEIEFQRGQADLTVFSRPLRMTVRLAAAPRIDRLVPIVAGTEEIRNCGNSPLNSRARFSDGSQRRFFGTRRINLYRSIKALPCFKTIEWE